MKIDITKVVYETANVSGIDIARAIEEKLYHYIRPISVQKYDSWYISDDNFVIGVTEYHHGSDTETKVEKASDQLVSDYKAIRRVLLMLTTSEIFK